MKDYTAVELIEILILKARESGLKLAEKAEESLRKLMDEMVETNEAKFGNAGEAIKILSEVKSRKANRIAAMMDAGEEITKEIFATVLEEDIPFDASKTQMGDYMAKLNKLIGLSSVKEDVSRLADYISVERAKCEALGKKFQGVGDHYLFVGNPGTGKTTVARIMADAFHALGVLPTNKLVETARDELVSGYVGQSAPQTREVFNRALGGVLFIDEAYSLKQNSHDNYGQESIDTLLKLMEDNRGKVIVIAAGYPKEMKQWIDSNSGLASRFNKIISFEDYTAEELIEIFKMKACNDDLILASDAEKVMEEHFQQLCDNKGRNFGNAREVNNYFAKIKTNQSSRLRQRMGEPDFDPNEFKYIILEDMHLQ